MSAVIYIDNARRRDIICRKGATFTKTFLVTNVNGTDYDFTDKTVTLEVYSPVGTTTVLNFATGSGLTLVTGEIQLLKTAAQMAVVRRRDYLYQLWITHASGVKEMWLNGYFVVNESVSDAPEDSTDSITINTGGSQVEISVTSAATVSDVPLFDFSTELTFDEDKDLTTVLGGTTTFTLSASGHKNGVGIFARINEPVAVNFPVSFEAISGSDSISITHMNVILFRYFEDYDGDGNDKVLYIVKNQTAI